MTDYSQHGEQNNILHYFARMTKPGQMNPEVLGNLLSIGENDGTTFSNSRALLELGWTGVLVEPAPIAYKKLSALYEGNNKVWPVKVAISDIDGVVDFYSSDSHLKKGDTDLVSTIKPEERDRWGATQNFTKTEVTSCSWQTFQHFMRHHLPAYSCANTEKFNFITIDAEGYDLCILKQMDLVALGCECLIIEHNGKDLQEFTATASPLKLIFNNGTNLIFVK